MVVMHTDKMVYSLTFFCNLRVCKCFCAVVGPSRHNVSDTFRGGVILVVKSRSGCFVVANYQRGPLYRA